MKVKEKYIKQPYEPYEPRKPEEFFETTKFVGFLLDEYDEVLEFSEFLERIERAIKDKDATKLVITRETHYGYYDEPDRSSIEIHEKVQQKNPRYKAELKRYKKELEKFKLDKEEYLRLKKLFDIQEARKNLKRLETELEDVKLGRAVKQLEKQKAKTLEKLNELSGEENVTI